MTWDIVGKCGCECDKVIGNGILEKCTVSCKPGYMGSSSSEFLVGGGIMAFGSSVFLGETGIHSFSKKKKIYTTSHHSSNFIRKSIFNNLMVWIFFLINIYYFNYFSYGIPNDHIEQLLISSFFNT